MRKTQAQVALHDAVARASGRPLPEVRYDLRYGSAAMWQEEHERLPEWASALVRQSRVWLARRFQDADPTQLREIEFKIDAAVAERLEKSIATTCGGFL